MRFLLVCVLTGLFLVGLAIGESRQQLKQIKALTEASQNLDKEVKAAAINLCWRLGQRAVMSPPGADRPTIQCEEAAL